MTSITRIHVAALGLASRDAARGQRFALWPEPVDHDACFEAAGFTAFADTDDAWDAQLTALVEAVVARLAALGELVVDGVVAVPSRSLVDRIVGKPAPALTMVQRLVSAASDDQLGPIRLRVGTPPRAEVTVGDGHPILWIWVCDDDAALWPALCAAAAAGRPVVETALDWARLAPDHHAAGL